MIRVMARKNYSEEFRRQAVDLYESTPGGDGAGDRRGSRHRARHVAAVAAGLRHGQEDRRGRNTDRQPAAGQVVRQIVQQVLENKGSLVAPADETPEQRIARLEARVQELEVETTKLTTEREILQRAAKCLCEAVSVRRSSFYAWLAAPLAAAARAEDDARLAEQIRGYP